MQKGIPGALETKRLRIRPYRQEDLGNVTLLLTDEEVVRQTGVTENQTEKEICSFFQVILNSYATRHPVCAFAIEEAATGTVVGSCGYETVGDYGDVQIYYALLPAGRGKGYATEASERLISFLLDEYGARRVIAYTASDNAPSVAIAERVGMELEEELSINGRHSLMYAIS
ncbi:hypothetical protein AZH53_09035 [Methanomicrobiaceae archaeon CYW5]|uniref:GNAT family N-acetyltransferase n=1 Tax=Methanovulcanius yangii TaxID=1789227 RepID=UPI0029CAA706|nr:GNAT family N-acetyltransferase [Methanovulcanius yangii]MBT8508547.1 hypothetical protein [Methanovulcanius yangii]